MLQAVRTACEAGSGQSRVSTSNRRRAPAGSAPGPCRLVGAKATISCSPPAASTQARERAADVVADPGRRVRERRDVDGDPHGRVGERVEMGAEDAVVGAARDHLARHGRRRDVEPARQHVPRRGCERAPAASRASFGTTCTVCPGRRGHGVAVREELRVAGERDRERAAAAVLRASRSRSARTRCRSGRGPSCVVLARTSGPFDLPERHPEQRVARDRRRRRARPSRR